MSNEELDTFDNPNVKENEGVNVTDEVLDTFDNPADDMWNEEPNKDDKKEDDKKKDDKSSQVDQMEDTEDDKEDSKDETEKKDEGEEQAEGEDSEGEGESVQEEAKEIDEDSIVEVKVDGKKEEVSIKDLMANYSGKVAYDKKFTEFSKEKKGFERKIEEYKEERAEVENELSKISNMINDQKGNPLDALYYILDKNGGNTVEFKQRVMATLADDFESLMDMDDTERELYWQKEENSFLRKRQENLTQRQASEQSNQELRANVDKLRQAHNVSEEDFVSAFNDLLDLGYSKEDIKPENVVRYVTVQPLVKEAEDTLAPFVDSINEEEYGDFVSEMVKGKQNFPEMSNEELLYNVSRKLGFDVEFEDDAVNEIEDKIDTKVKSKKLKNNPKEKETEKLDMFDDIFY